MPTCACVCADMCEYVWMCWRPYICCSALMTDDSDDLLVTHVLDLEWVCA